MDEIQVTANSEDWDDITLDDLPQDDDADEADSQPEADQQTGEQEAEQQPETEPEEEGQQAEDADQRFELKHLDEIRSVNREEVIALAQKGMDYDRIRERYDAAKPTIEWYEKNADTVRWLEEMAKEQGMTLGEMVDETRAEIMAKNTNQSVSVCRGIVASEREARGLEAQRKAISTESDSKARMEADVQAFVKAYPDAAKDPSGLPAEVWDAVHQGETLVNAYRAWENKQLRAQLEKQKTEAQRKAQEEKNKSRSTGSQSSAGKADIDAFDAAWYNED